MPSTNNGFAWSEREPDDFDPSPTERLSALIREAVSMDDVRGFRKIEIEIINAYTFGKDWKALIEKYRNR